MGKRLNALLGRKAFKASKLKTLLGLTLTRLVVLKNQRHARCSHARSGISQAISLGRRDRALDCAEYVMKEQSMLDLFVMVETYCRFLSERASLLESTKVCPDEMREAVASLIYVSSRSGELPELQDVRTMFSLKFGSDFVSAAVDVRNNCGVNAKIISLVSIKQPSLESKLKMVKDVATEKGIPFDLEEENTSSSSSSSSSSDTISMITEKEVVVKKKPSPPHVDSSKPSEYYWKYSLPESIKTSVVFRDAAAAAQAAFESAAFAAAAARAAVDLSRSRSHGKGSGDHSLVSSERSGFDEFRQAEIRTSESETEQMAVHNARNPKAEKGKEIWSDDEGIRYSKERITKPRNGTRYGVQSQSQGGQFDEESGSEEDEGDIVTKNGEIKYDSPYRRRRPTSSEENPLDKLHEEMRRVELRTVEEDSYFSAYTDDSPRNDGTRSQFTHSPSGKNPLSVRTRRGSIINRWSPATKDI